MAASIEARVNASLGIDLGASKAIIGALDAAGNILSKSKVDIRGCAGDSGKVLPLVAAEAARVCAAAGLSLSDIGFIGMGVPGTVDREKNRVIYAPNLDWHDVEVDPVMRGRLGQSAVLVQDSWAGALAEYLRGAARGHRVVACITLGTGIGTGIIIDGKIYHGAYNALGETGHLVVEDDGEPCGCGRRGCVEAYASGRGIVRAARAVQAWSDRESIHDAEVVFQRAAAGDPEARRIIDSAVRHLGMGIVNTINVLGPGIVVLSGGMCTQEELLVAPVRDYVMRRAYTTILAGGALRIVTALLGEEAPMIGAALLYKGT
jgi:glucokinase